jgi:hypothetical protein
LFQVLRPVHPHPLLPATAPQSRKACGWYDSAAWPRVAAGRSGFSVLPHPRREVELGTAEVGAVDCGIEPASAAAFATNQILFTIELYIDRLFDDLRAVGANPTNLLESAPPGKLPSGILRWIRPDNLKITLNRAGLQQLAYEPNDPTTWVRASESAPMPPERARRWSSYVCLANEMAVWS